MASIDFTVKGDNKLVGKLEDVSDRSFKRIRLQLHRDVINMRNHIILSMKRTKRASWFYSRQKGKKKHFPSLPYEYPAVDRGELWKHILINVSKNKVEVGPGEAYAPYAKFLEGWPQRTRHMEPRPFLRPTWKKFEPTIKENIINTIAKEFKK
jgi:HK97 gp10 family phage protein